MVNWQEAGKTWPRPHPHAVRLLRGLQWDKHYRHSHPQCEGGMLGNFELREDMGPDRLQAVVDWLRVEGFTFCFRQRRWRVWTRPDRPVEGLRPDGIEEDEKPNEYPSGATINVSMSSRRTSRNGGASARCRAAAAARLRGRRGGPPGTGSGTGRGGSTRSPWPPKPPKAPRAEPQPAAPNGPVAVTTSATPPLATASKSPSMPRPNPCQLHLRKSGPSSDVESAHRGRMPADQASSSSSVAPDQRDVARACERACGVLCNLRVAPQRATQQNAAMEGDVVIAQQEPAEWEHGMAIHASTVAAIAAGLTAGAAHEAGIAQVKGEVAAAAEEARLTQEAIACKENEVKALEEALAQERAKKEAEERTQAEATIKAQADAAKKDAIEAAQRKVAEERAKTEAELAALEAEKARLQQAREAEAARAREEAEGRAAAATAAAMAEAEAKLRRETPPGGSRVETLRKLFEGDASSKMALDP